MIGKELYFPPDTDRKRKWDRWFLGLATYISSASKDPSTQTGAVIVDPDRRVISVGYNGLSQGTKDTDERLQNRDLKYKLIIHCEVNALIFAQRDVTGCTLYTYPFLSCSNCASIMIQAGIHRVVAPALSDELRKRWGENIELSKQLFREAFVEITEYYPNDTFVEVPSGASYP